jgi:hypothetical protein
MIGRRELPRAFEQATSGSGAIEDLEQRTAAVLSQQPMGEALKGLFGLASGGVWDIRARAES